MIDLFTFSHAGGNSKFFSSLTSMLNHNINCFTYEYKGRGTRFDEPLNDSMQEILEDAASFIIKNKKSEKFAILGYSLGSSVCYFLADYLMKKYLQYPSFIFFMANTAPYVHDEEKDIAFLSEEEFWHKMREYGGIPDELFLHKDILDLYSPILRSDLNCENEYKTETVNEITCNFSVMYSPEDEKVAENIYR